MEEADWYYEYRPFLAEMNQTIKKLNHPGLLNLWKATKADVAAFAKSISRVEGETYKLVHSLTWSRWEDLFTDPEYFSDDEEALVLCAIEFREQCPPDLWPHVNYALEVAFGRGRGFSRKDAMAQQDDFIASQGGWTAFYHPQNNSGAGFLTVIEGGKA